MNCEQSPGVYLRDDPLLGAQLQQHSELRVPTAERAAFYLDAAVAARSTSQRGAAQGANEDSHFLFTLHVYQYSVDRSGKGGVAGGRSRLHLLDLGSCERGRAGGGIPLSGVANVLLAIFNGQKHLPYRCVYSVVRQALCMNLDRCSHMRCRNLNVVFLSYREHKVTQLLRECLGSLTCHVAMIAHVSPLAQHYAETLTAVQLAARIHRMRRRRIKFGCVTGGAGSGGSSGEDTRATGAAGGGNSSSDVDPSSSEQSADTVIYVGPCGDDATDGEHPPVYIPSLNSGDNRCAMGKALRGSAAERPRGSPAKSAKSSSADSSPARSLATRTPARAAATTTAAPKSPQVTRQTKTGKVVDPKTGKSSDEQWIDGPRISRSKVAEARSLLKEKRETWVDGPQAGSGQAATASTTGSQVGYGFMDNHKKTMIQRWVENQTVQIQQKLQRTHEYKELTVFKTCEEETEPPATATSQPVQQPTQSAAPQPDEAPSEPVLTSVCEHDEAEDEEDDALGELPPPLPLLLPHNKEISIDVSLDNYDVRMRILQERRLQGASIGDDDEVEIIEVEEPEEPVPMQDSCLQNLSKFTM
ncbi:hypothetical protein B566_EDAN014167 [Ephemera danica]|nr:hypothetical protein B566_EDAN014167 [Ephemera danica]